MDYPPALLAQGIEGRVLLRLYVDAPGRLMPDSTRIAESSGYPALDSAALPRRAAAPLRARAARAAPVAPAFLQPIQFRNPRDKEAA